MTSSGSWSARKSRRRSSPPTLADELMCLRADPVSGLDGRGGVRRPSRESGSSRGRRAARSSRPAPSGASTWRWTRPTGFSCVPPPGPATPVTAMPTSTPSRRGLLRPSPPPPRRTRRRARDEHLGHAELGRLDVVRVGHDAAGEDVARARHVREPRGHEPARAGLRGREPVPALAAQREHDLRDRPLVLREEVALERRDAARRRASPRAPRRPARRRGRRGSRSRARRSSPRPRPRHRRHRRAPSPRPTRSRRRTAGRVARVASSAARTAPSALLATAAATVGEARPVGPGGRRRRTGRPAGRAPGPSLPRRSPRRRRARSPASSRPPRSPRTAGRGALRSIARRPRSPVRAVRRRGGRRRRRARRARPCGRRASAPARPRRGRPPPRFGPRAPPRARGDRRRRSGSGRGRARARAPPAHRTGRSDRCARPARARCP